MQGSLAVIAGQRLSLFGGTVVNTGTLTAPGGQITIAAIPGQSLVRLTAPGSLLSFEIDPLSPRPSSAIATPQPSLPNTWVLPIAALPALLTGGDLQNATRITVNPDGTIRLLAVPQQSILVLVGHRDRWRQHHCIWYHIRDVLIGWHGAGIGQSGGRDRGYHQRFWQHRGWHYSRGWWRAGKGHSAECLSDAG